MPSRGCGDERTPGDLYLVKKVGLGGVPIWCFVTDPPVLFRGGKFQGIQVAPPEMTEGWPNDAILLLDMVGETFYPSPADFVEEARIHGLSRKIQETFPTEQLVGKQVYLGLVHWKAIPEYGEEPLHDYEFLRCAYTARYKPEEREEKALEHWQDCIYHLWPIAGQGERTRKLYSPSGKLVVEYDPFEVVLPQHRDVAVLRRYDVTGYLPGVFMIVPITQAELVVPAGDETQRQAYAAQKDAKMGLRNLPFWVSLTEE